MKNKILDKITCKYLPLYINLWPTQFIFALWSAPIRYTGCKNLPDRWDSSWKALRITIRKNHNPIIILKKGTI